MSSASTSNPKAPSATAGPSDSDVAEDPGSQKAEERPSKSSTGCGGSKKRVFAAFVKGLQGSLTEEQVTKGRQLFTDNGCNSCHTLADANAAGSVGPSFDGNANLDKGHVVAVVSNGQGPMPSFVWLGEEDINLIASYIVQVKK